MSRTEELAAVEQEMLERQLAQLALDMNDPLHVLGQLAQALFSAGPGERHQVTWGEASTKSQALEPADAEARLRSAELRFRTLVEQIPAVTFLAVLGDGKNEIYISPHIEHMLGFTQEEWLEAPFLWYWQLHPDDRQLLNDEFARGCRTGGPFKAECRFLARDGHVVWVHGEARLVKDELGRPMMLQGVAFDITDSKRAQNLLLERALREAKHKEELLIAHRVQSSILPKDPRVPGLELATAMFPAEEVGGDYFDVMPIDDGAWIAIGDVSGHGLDSGLVMLMVQSAMAALARANPKATPAALLVSLNEVLYENIRSRLDHDDHVTFSLLRYTNDGRIVFAGGHEDMLVCRRATGRVESVPTTGTWLGGRRSIADVTQDAVLQLAEGDAVVLFTDGITEAMNELRQQFSIERLIQTVEAAHDKTCEEIREHVLSTVREWMHKQEDDSSLVVFRYEGKAGASAAAPLPVGKAVKRVLITRSIFDSEAEFDAVEALQHSSTSDRLSSRGFTGPGVVGVRFAGVAETPDRADLGRLMNSLHAAAVEQPASVVELDVRALTFLNSSCFKEMVTWIAAIRALDEGQRYRVRIVADPVQRWQRASVQALLAFAQGLLVPEHTEVQSS